jgi:hypothetical protein
MPAGSTYTPIATTTLGSTNTSVTFNSFSGYTDLVLVFSVKAATANLNTGIRFNSDSGSNYNSTSLEGNGSTTRSQVFNSADFIRTDSYSFVPTDSFSVKIVNIENYANSTTYKTALTRSNTASAGVDAFVGMWRNTNAITAIEVYARNDTFAIGSTFTLYGIAAA